MGELSELGKILMVGRELLVKGDRSADHLAKLVGVSPATLKRYLADLRHLGCEIVSRRESGGWVYRLENGDAVQVRMLRWLDLERKRTLVSESDGGLF